MTFEPAGTRGYADLRRDAAPVELYGVKVRVASVADVIRSKQAANRPKDQRVLPTLVRSWPRDSNSKKMPLSSSTAAKALLRERYVVTAVRVSVCEPCTKFAGHHPGHALRPAVWRVG